KGRSEEFKGFTWTDVPDPFAEDTFRRSRIDRARKDENALRWHKSLLALRRDHPALQDDARQDVRASTQGSTLLLQRGPVLVVARRLRRRGADGCAARGPQPLAPRRRIDHPSARRSLQRASRPPRNAWARGTAAPAGRRRPARPHGAPAAPRASWIAGNRRHGSAGARATRQWRRGPHRRVAIPGREPAAGAPRPDVRLSRGVAGQGG